VPCWCKYFRLHQIGADCHIDAIPETYIKLHTAQLFPPLQGFIGVLSIMVLALLYLEGSTYLPFVLKIKVFSMRGKMLVGQHRKYLTDHSKK
jgi:hypothetical protein